MIMKQNKEKFDFKAFGQAIKAARKAKGISRNQLADTLNIAPRYIASIDFGSIFLHTVQYKADMFAVQFHKFCFYKLCRVVVPGDTDCSSFGADGFKIW